MNPTSNPYKTGIMAAPANDSDCESLEIYWNGVAMVSAWEPTEEELAALNRGERVWLCIYGQMHPMVSLYVAERPVEPKL